MNPTVCAILLTADRAELTKKAVECFRAQTYENKRLLIWDTGQSHVDIPEEMVSSLREKQIYHEWWSAAHIAHKGITIGKLRNTANGYTTQWSQTGTKDSDILIHWDSDDYSHPNRIAEQVALLQSSGADCVGYNELMFWKEARCSCGCTFEEDPTKRGYYGIDCDTREPLAPEAWLYFNHRPNFALGTSLCYWRTTWEAKPFENIPRPGDVEGEDGRFIRGLKVASISAQRSVEISLLNNGTVGTLTAIAMMREHTEPRLIARIHSGNTSDQYRDIAQSGNWKRVPEWDQRVREIMQ